MLYFNSNIYHKFKKFDKYFLFNVENLAVFEIDEISFRILNFPITPINEKSIYKNFLKYDKKDINKTISTLKYWEVLIDSFPVKTKSNTEVNYFKNSIDQNQHYIDGIFLCVTNECNLRCKYCYADYGHFGLESNNNMSQKTAKKAIDYLIKHLTPANRRPVITFIGGEPLANFEVLRYSVQYAKSFDNLNPIFSLNTNGTLMSDEIAKWFYENNIEVTFSIDGSKEIHDKNRVYKNNKGSFDNTLKGINTYMKYYENGFNAQTSIPRAIALEESVKFLWSIGAKDVRSNIATESTMSSSKDCHMNAKDWELYDKQIESLCMQSIDNVLNGHGSPIINKTFSFFKSLNSRKIYPKTCGYGKFVAITSDDNIFPCQSLVGFHDHLLGNLDGGIDLNKIRILGNVYTKYLDKCNNCWANNICRSACIALQIHNNRLTSDQNPSMFCNSSLKFIELSIYMYTHILINKPELLNQY